MSVETGDSLMISFKALSEKDIATINLQAISSKSSPIDHLLEPKKIERLFNS